MSRSTLQTRQSFTSRSSLLAAAEEASTGRPELTLQLAHKVFFRFSHNDQLPVVSMSDFEIHASSSSFVHRKRPGRTFRKGGEKSKEKRKGKKSPTSTRLHRSSWRGSPFSLRRHHPFEEGRPAAASRRGSEGSAAGQQLVEAEHQLQAAPNLLYPWREAATG